MNPQTDNPPPVEEVVLPPAFHGPPTRRRRAKKEWAIRVTWTTWYGSRESYLMKYASERSRDQALTAVTKNRSGYFQRTTTYEAVNP